MARLNHASAAPFFFFFLAMQNRFRPARFLAFPCFFARPVDGTIAVVAPSLSWLSSARDQAMAARLRVTRGRADPVPI